MSTILHSAGPAAAATAPPAAFVALAGICFQRMGEWLSLGENTFVEQGLSSTITLLEPLAGAATRASIGSLRQGNYLREGRILSREQLLSELEAEPVAFQAQVQFDENQQAWMVQRLS